MHIFYVVGNMHEYAKIWNGEYASNIQYCMQKYAAQYMQLYAYMCKFINMEIYAKAAKQCCAVIFLYAEWSPESADVCNPKLYAKYATKNKHKRHKRAENIQKHALSPRISILRKNMQNT